MLAVHGSLFRKATSSYAARVLRAPAMARTASRTYFGSEWDGSSSASQTRSKPAGRHSDVHRMLEDKNYNSVINDFEKGKISANDNSIKAYLSALVATGKIWQLNVPRFVARLRGGGGDSESSASGNGGSSGKISASTPLRTGEGDSASRPLHVSVVQNKKGSLFRSLVVAVGVLGALYYLLVAPGAKRSPFNMKATHQRAENVTETFDDVKGVDEATEELREVVEYLRNPRKFTRLGARLPRGVLLSGPPGTGKTLLARAVAGEAGVPFFYTSGSSFDEMFVGVGPRRVRELFDAAKKHAPCIIFIDEIDAVGGSRSARSMMSNRESLNQLLTEMDGFEQTSGIIVLAATNLPDALDSALVRPGRFDRSISVTAPDIKGRTDIIDLYLKRTKVGPDVVSSKLARGTPGFTGADLANLVNIAAVKASVRGAPFVTQTLLEEAKDDVLMGVVRASAAARMPEQERLMTAYHEGGHALVAYYTPGADPLHKATILPRGRSLGATFQLPENDQYSVTRQQLVARIATAMGGRAAEDLIYGREGVSTGASNDFQVATQLATNMVSRWGMSDTVGFVYHNDEAAAKNASVQAEVKELLQQQYSYATDILKQHEPGLHRVARALLEREQLDGSEIATLLEGRSLKPMAEVVGIFNGAPTPQPK